MLDNFIDTLLWIFYISCLVSGLFALAIGLVALNDWRESRARIRARIASQHVQPVHVTLLINREAPLMATDRCSVCKGPFLPENNAFGICADCVRDALAEEYDVSMPDDPAPHLSLVPTHTVSADRDRDYDADDAEWEQLRAILEDEAAETEDHRE
jgi:hypothetical protein